MTRGTVGCASYDKKYKSPAPQAGQNGRSYEPFIHPRLAFGLRHGVDLQPDPELRLDIILFTLLINLIKIPLQLNQQKSMAKMSSSSSP